MNRYFCVFVRATFFLLAFLLSANLLIADVTVKTESSQGSSFFQFETIPPPAIDDSAASGTWSVARGKPDSNSAPLSVLNDGQIPSGEDSPTQNFFFAPGESNGCVVLDLGEPIDLAEVVTYSWHVGSRGPHVFTLYGSVGDQPDFRGKQLKLDEEPTKAGWTRLADVDTRATGALSGQHASRVSDTAGSLGRFRYLLFEVRPTETKDPFGNTFFSEIDVVARDAKEPKRIAVPDVQLIRFSSPDGKYDYTIEVTAAPEMADWTESELKPMILQWYPRIVAMLPSDGFEAPSKIRFRYLPGNKMEGIPAYAQGATISMNADWMRREKKREALGAIVHEMVHVVQSYQGRRQGNGRRTPTPGWIVEGIPDYIRWFHFEPQSKGAELSKTALSKAKHDASYRISANFIDWVIRTFDRDGLLLQRLNKAAREGRYDSDLWKEMTGKSEEDLAEEWKKG